MATPESQKRTERRKKAAPAKSTALSVANLPEAAPEPKSVGKAVRLFALREPADMLNLSKELAKFIKDNKLSTTVQGKEFVNVEGWQYAGARLGIVPVVEHTINVSNGEEMKYQAKVTLFDLRAQTTVGAGFAVCSNKESGKKFYQEFAIMSMAQTRATGKAFRNVLAWVIRAAGYEPTPAEEMDYNTNTAAPAAKAEPRVEPDNSQIMQILPTDSGADKTEPAQPVQYATAAQKEEIIRLLNNPVIEKGEKTKMLLNINRLDEERAFQAIAKLKKAIEDREKKDDETAPQ